MRKTYPRRHILEKEAIVVVFLYIVEKGKTHSRNIMRDLPVAQTAAFATVKRLKEARLIKETQQHTFPFTKVLEPTEAGKQVADHLQEINKILEAAS